MASETIRPLVREGDDLARAIEEAGWLPGEVKAAAIFRQGHSPSMLASVVGIGLIAMLRKPAGDLPRTFVLAATAGRVSGFRARGVSHGEGSDADYYVTIWPDEVAGWARELVHLERAKKGIQVNATILVEGESGARAIPVTSQADETVEALLAELQTDRWRT